MSFLDSLAGLLSKIWDFIKDNFIYIIIILLIVIAIFFPLLWGAFLTNAGLFWGWLGTQAAGIATFIAGLGLEGALAVALGAAVLIDPEGVGEAFGSIIESVGSVATDLFGSPLLLFAAIGAGVYFLSGKSEDESSPGSYSPEEDVITGSLDESADDWSEDSNLDDPMTVVIL
jgi:hypothetical protein